jgi:hypothetical protein
MADYDETTTARTGEERPRPGDLKGRTSPTSQAQSLREDRAERIFDAEDATDVPAFHTPERTTTTPASSKVK